ncbi:MAG: hypothetical protein ACP5NV_02225 [Candidatus Woesearchaeota archaeon]
MSLATLTSGFYLAKALSGQPDVAVLNDSVATQNDSAKTEVMVENPHELTWELAPANNTEKLVNFQKIKLVNNNFGLEYDLKGTKTDVLKLSFKEKNIGLNLYKTGDWTRDDAYYWEAWKTFESANNTFLIDVGTGHGKKTLPQYFVIGKITNNKIILEAGLFQTAENFFNVDTSFYGYGAYDQGKVYVGVGKNPTQNVGIFGIKGFDDFGNFTYVLNNPKTKSWNIKSQTCFVNANQGFFNKKLFDFAGELFAVPGFPDVHLGPLVTKGGFTLKVAAIGDPKKTELEAMIGVDNAVLPFAVGVNNLYENRQNNSNFTIELYKVFDGKGYNASVEGKYNARTGDMTGYIKMNYSLR